MTEHNIFHEVQEDLERQKLEALWKRFGIWIIAAALLVVIGTAGSSAYRSHKAQRDQDLTQGLLDAMHGGPDVNKAIDDLLKYAGANAGSNQAAFALLRAGSLAAEQNDTGKAITLFDRVANDGEADAAYRQLGELLSVRAQLDTGDAAQLFKRLHPLTNEGKAWRYSALEAQGVLALRLGDKDQAKQIFTSLSQDSRTPQTIAERATDVLRGIN